MLVPENQLKLVVGRLKFIKNGWGRKLGGCVIRKKKMATEILPIRYVAKTALCATQTKRSWGQTDPGLGLANRKGRPFSLVTGCRCRRKWCSPFACHKRGQRNVGRCGGDAVVADAQVRQRAKCQDARPHLQTCLQPSLDGGQLVQAAIPGIFGGGAKVW